MQQFCFKRAKAIFDSGFVEIDISPWLTDEIISNVVFSAVDSSGNDATAEVVDIGQSTFDISNIYPFVKDGIDGERYNVLCQMTTVQGNEQEFRLVFNVREAP